MPGLPVAEIERLETTLSRHDQKAITASCQTWVDDLGEEDESGLPLADALEVDEPKVDPSGSASTPRPRRHWS